MLEETTPKVPVHTSAGCSRMTGIAEWQSMIQDDTLRALRSCLNSELGLGAGASTVSAVCVTRELDDFGGG